MAGLFLISVSLQVLYFVTGAAAAGVVAGAASFFVAFFAFLAFFTFLTGAAFSAAGVVAGAAAAVVASAASAIDAANTTAVNAMMIFFMSVSPFSGHCPCFFISLFLILCAAYFVTGVVAPVFLLAFVDFLLCLCDFAGFFVFVVPCFAVTAEPADAAVVSVARAIDAANTTAHISIIIFFI
jgi:hypothetical protein